LELLLLLLLLLYVQHSLKGSQQTEPLLMLKQFPLQHFAP
jgi:hypothetical protein